MHVEDNPLRPDPAALGRAWRALVEGERAQVEAVREFADRDHYAPVAQHFAEDPRRRGDAVLDALLALTTPETTWLDIGAGGGRYALPLALHSKRVLAVEPSEAMRAVLAEGMRANGVSNVEVLPLRWPDDAAGVQADCTLLAHVTYDIADINAFLDAAEAATRRRCVCFMMDRAPSSGFTRLWQQVHGEPRVPLPSVRELLSLLLARGALPEVRLFPRDMRPLTADQLPEMARRRLWLREGSAKDQQLRALLADDAGRAQEDDAFPTAVGMVTWAPAT